MVAPAGAAGDRENVYSATSVPPTVRTRRLLLVVPPAGTPERETPVGGVVSRTMVSKTVLEMLPAASLNWT